MLWKNYRLTVTTGEIVLIFNCRTNSLDVSLL
jgi:hypothetical protein